jgi:tetratricopeptide (TPR) repeat protein
MDDTGDSPTLASAHSGAGQVVAGRYRIRARLGRGAAKEVYLAYDERLDREVALALVTGAGQSEKGRRRVEREARVTGRLGDHPNVVTVYDTGEVEGVPYLVLRAMPRGSLADMLAVERPPVATALRLGRDVAAALAHAHAHGVVHRDVKPDNIWLGADGTAALGDFGVAQEAGAERLTAEGVVVGTVRYVAPEQIRGEEATPATDLYALGVTLYEMVAGRPPFVADEAAAVFAQHLTAAPVPPSEHAPDLPRALEDLILALLAKAPGARPGSAAEVAGALAALGEGGARSGPPLPAGRRPVAVLAARAGGADPEALHGVLDRCAEVIAQHGGAPERHLGDALIGLFGLTAAHGDDTLRAARAAAALRAADDGLALGVEAGEVYVAGGASGSADVTGAAITAAARLAATAAPGEILLGAAARRALERAADIDPQTGRLLALHADRPALLHATPTPFVDRVDELGALRAAFSGARAERACRVVTVAGPPGIGKSRLAAELLAGLSTEATVLAGQCPADGEGPAYAPLQELVRGLGGGDEGAFLESSAHVEETAWALRRLLERAAGERPLVVAVEDVHWAHDALLEILDHVVTLWRGAPMLLVCLARSDLLERRPAWAAPAPRRSVLVLDALGDGDARGLARQLGADEHDAGRIASRAEGNPLFVEQLVAVDAGADELPVSIQAVLAARIDALDEGERALLRCAAVEGRTFHAGALAALLPDGGRGARTRLVGLAHRGLIAAADAQYEGEDAFRFTHALIREAAYAGLPKRERIALHAALATWLELRVAAADEVIAHQLEQACRLSADLGRGGEPERVLARRAVARLEAAARAALARGDPAAAAALLERAVALAPGPPARAALLPALGAARFQAGALADAARVLDEAIATATTPALLARARVERAFVRLEADPATGAADAARVADAALGELARTTDDLGQARAWSLRAQAAWTTGRVGEADAAWEQAADFARRGGDERELFAVLAWRATAAVLGPTPVDEALRRCEAFRALVATSPVAVASMVNPMASLHAMQGEPALAERDLREANATLHELGSLFAGVSHHEALVRLIDGRPELAEIPLRAGVETLEAMGDQALLATTTAMLAQAVFAQGRHDEARALCRRTAETAADDDIVTQMLWRAVEGRLLAAEGRCEEAVTVARRAVALVAETDLLSHRGDAMLDLAEVLRACSAEVESVEAVERALALYEQKGNAVGAARARALLSRLTREG